MKTVSLRLSDEMAERLESAARRSGTTLSEFMRLALENYLNGKRRKGKAFALIADLAGTVKDTPPDLSTNKRYLEGLGR